ncbi:hypothetical protein [Polaribacter glomeratus]|uniref:Uncharacterized protein n=1 Tax=Polaribacter glomeratus TaxID=102 RepID=A0A2S7WIT8_9FLAO|nr:hypothetical protein [Polaribacter glomeratus]PQJ77517.1 hypothetical protein BTO16_17005 [Polaribacter glomeratus]TXD66109.1 hypothetical protein ESX12_08095 [Polaribacter glomeratus]
MENRIEKILTLTKDFKNIYDIEIVLNPELLDEYFYSVKKKVKHHLCLIKDYLEDYNLFISLIKLYKIHPDYFINKQENTSCNGCLMNCINHMHPTFNFACYIIIANIEVRGSSIHEQDKNSLVINCLNLFSIKDELLFYDYEKMIANFTEFDFRSINHILSQNIDLKNLEYLNKLGDSINSIDSQISIFYNYKKKPCVIKKHIKNKKKYFDKKIIIDEKLKEIEEVSTPVSFNFENNFDKIDKNTVYNYFNDSLVKKGYLTKVDLEKYLLLAFQDKELPKEKFTFIKIDIGNIINIFYKYYRIVAAKPHGKQINYAELLGIYFEGFNTQKVKNNFAKNY